MTKVVKIIDSFFATDGHGVARELFVGGQTYPVTPESEVQILRGNAELVDAPDEAPSAEQPAAPAKQTITLKAKS